MNLFRACRWLAWVDASCSFGDGRDSLDAVVQGTCMDLSGRVTGMDWAGTEVSQDVEFMA